MSEDKKPNPLAMAALSKAFRKVGEERGIASFVESADRLKAEAIAANEKERSDKKEKGPSNE